MNSHSLLIIGCGSIGERHLRCFQKTGRATVAACDTNPALLERMEKEYSVATFSDVSVAMEHQWDAVVICVPAHLHVKIARMALAKGSAVFLEKPLAVDLTDVDALLDEARASGRYNAVAYVYHLMPWIAAARHVLLKGELGKPLHLTMTAGQHFPTFRPAYREIYYTKHETGGGAIQDALTHVVNAMEWLLGPITRVFCDASHQMLEGVSVEDTVNLAVRHGDVLGSYALNQFQAPNEVTILIHCEGGSLRIEGHKQTWSVQLRGESGWTEHKTMPMERDDIFIAQASAYLDGLEGRHTPLATLEEAAQTLRVNIAALRSVSTAMPINIPIQGQS